MSIENHLETILGKAQARLLQAQRIITAVNLTEQGLAEETLKPPKPEQLETAFEQLIDEIEETEDADVQINYKIDVIEGILGV
jgi:hypothetical protein